jgi:hypothetical protein
VIGLPAAGALGAVGFEGPLSAANAILRLALGPGGVDLRVEAVIVLRQLLTA